MIAAAILVVAGSAVALAAMSGGPTGAVGPVGACLNPFVTHFSVQQQGMVPALQPGDTIVAPAVPAGTTFTRGEIILFRAPASFTADQSPFIKRVVGLPGETISLAGGRVLVNGAPLHEPYLAPGTVTDPMDKTSWTLGPSDLFVLGDGRSKSADSRAFGPVSVSSVTGHATEICAPDSRKGTLP